MNSSVYLWKHRNKLIISFLLAINLFTLVKINVLLNNIAAKKNELKKYQYFDSENKKYQKFVNFSTYKFNEIKFVYDLKIARNKLHLIAILDDMSCPSCVEMEVEYLNKLNLSFPNCLTVYFVGENNNYLKSIGAKFQYYIVKSNNKFFDRDFKFSKPASFLIGKDNLIYLSHIAESGGVNKSRIFFNQVQYLFEISIFR